MWVSRRTDYATRAILALAIEGAARSSSKRSPAARRSPVGARAGDADDADGESSVPSGDRRVVTGSTRSRRDHARADRPLFQGPLAPISCARATTPSRAR